MRSDSPLSVSGPLLGLVARNDGVRDLGDRVLMIDASVDILEELAHIAPLDVRDPTLSYQLRDHIEEKFVSVGRPAKVSRPQPGIRPDVESDINTEFPMW